jgi:hypothetical protein
MLGFGFWAWRTLFRYDMYDCMIHKIGHPSYSYYLPVRSSLLPFRSDQPQIVRCASGATPLEDFYSTLYLVLPFHLIFTFRTRGGNGIKDTCVLASNGNPCNSSRRIFRVRFRLSGFLIFAHWAWKWRLLGTGGLASASRAGEILTLRTLLFFICIPQDGLRFTTRRGFWNREGQIG